MLFQYHYILNTKDERMKNIRFPTKFIGSKKRRKTFTFFWHTQCFKTIYKFLVLHLTMNQRWC